jgi:predicted TIM-barrel fold metal-dependent hydrolase
MRAAPRAASLALLMALPVQLAGQSMSIEEYAPRSTLRVPEHLLTRAKYPFVDVHSHQRPGQTPAQLSQLLRDMDSLNLAVMVDLSGGANGRVADKLRMFRGSNPKRFVVFTNVDFSNMDQPGWTVGAVKQLEVDVRTHGARGLKIFKNLGLTVKDGKGRVRTDDPRIDPVWAKAGELGIPVLIHTGEPAPFFDAIDERNERWLELKLHPDRARPAAQYPSWEAVMQEQWRMFRKHPRTTFINAHLGWLGNDLDRLGRLLDENPNVYTELAAVAYELGRQPRRAREFLIRYQDRVLMGKDTWAPAEYHTYFRILETPDEYFDWFRNYHAHWKMYGLDLPDAVLRKLYYGNALKVIPGLDRSLFPAS